MSFHGESKSVVGVEDGYTVYLPEKTHRIREQDYSTDPLRTAPYTFLRSRCSYATIKPDQTKSTSTKEGQGLCNELV